jgi:TRAP-type mannitol/chloroaromatic compound transport system permease small subunit
VTALLRLSKLIDALTERIGRAVAWLILAAVLISAVNAVVRKVFDMSSNAYLEVQWYLFAAVVLLASGYTLLRQDHVRIDVVIGRFSKRTQIAIEATCIVIFLLPFCLTVITLAWPVVMRSYLSGEMSQNAGGLIRWPVYALVPVGFSLLLLQAVSEFIKRIGFLMGRCDDPTRKQQTKSAEEEFAEFVRAKAEGAAK